MDRRKLTLAGAAVGVAAGVLGVVVLAMPADAGPSPVLPPTSPEQLVESVLTAKPPAASGTVEARNALGLPALPGLPQVANGTSQIRVWSDGNRRSRISLPSPSGEQTIVDDGTTTWKWDSTTRTVTKSADEQGKQAPLTTTEKTRPTDPASAAKELVSLVSDSSTVSVDGTGTVAGRPVYQLVLTPKPNARTLLREVRVAVDSALRVPLRVSVLANGSTDPALQIGFTDLSVAAPDPALFGFTPPAGATVTQPEQKSSDQTAKDTTQPTKPTIVGTGWDTVVITTLPSTTASADTGTSKGEGAQRDPLAMIQRIGTPVSGTWGNGWVLTTKVGTALVTSDGRIAAGAVPQQVLTEALGSAK